MKKIFRYILPVIILSSVALDVAAQESSSSAVMRRNDRNRRDDKQSSQVTTRMQNRMQQTPPSDADLSWMRVIYRSLDLTKDKNAPLYFPEMPEEGSESLFRLMMRLITNDQLTAYEYLDGREVFTDQYKINVPQMLDRFHIYAQPAKGHSEKHPKYDIEPSDLPANEVLSYFIVERWEFDNRTNRMRTRVEAICPVLHRSDDYGMEAMKYPMFWVKYDDIRPYLSTQNIFVSDDNNLPTCTYDDYFQLGLYEGDIYKTRNLRNKSMAQLYPDPEAMKHAQDSIQRTLDTFEEKLWVPSPEELEKRKQAAAEAESAVEETNDESTVEADATEKTEKSDRKSVSKRGSKKQDKKSEKKSDKKSKQTKVKKAKTPKTNSAPSRSVRNRRR
ncbi:MAG: gliding motility protein GldN [Paramuribaculum sp.]|nr:gliding motility protein GldN [Paramuribaculum sp.]